MQNPSRYKFYEARYFLARMKECFAQDDEFRFHLSAFVSAARHITFYMQNQYGRVPNFPQWYCAKQIAMKADPELKYLNKLRVEAVHTEPTDLGSTRQGSITADAVIVAASLGAEQAKSYPKAQEYSTGDVKTVRRFLPKFDDRDAVPFCAAQLEKLESLLDECETLFPGT